MSATDLGLPGRAVQTLTSALPSGHDIRTLVTVSRTHESDARQRQVLMRLDDGPTDTLMFGEAVTREISPGPHVLHANNTLVWKRLAFTIEPGGHEGFQLINRPGRLTLGFLALLGVAPLYLSIEKTGGTTSP